MVEETENNIDEENEETSANQPIPEIDSTYSMIILAAQRSKQLQRGATPRVEADMRKQKPTRVAMREIKGKKINFELLEVKL